MSATQTELLSPRHVEPQRLGPGHGERGGVDQEVAYIEREAAPLPDDQAQARQSGGHPFGVLPAAMG